MLVTRMPRDSRIAAREAAAIPFPRLETTPPVTKTYFVMNARCGVNAEVYRKRRPRSNCLSSIAPFAAFANGAKHWVFATREADRGWPPLLFRGTCKSGKCRDRIRARWVG